MYCPECDSSNVHKEIIAGSKTGDYQCGDCQFVGTPSEFKTEPSKKEDK